MGGESRCQTIAVVESIMNFVSLFFNVHSRKGYLGHASIKVVCPREINTCPSARACVCSGSDYFASMNRPRNIHCWDSSNIKFTY